MTEPRKPKCFETAFELLREGAARALAEVPELRSVVVVADWEVGENDFPAAIAVSRDGDRVSAEVVAGRLRQLLKAHARHLDYLRQLAAAAEHAARGKVGENADKKELPGG